MIIKIFFEIYNLITMKKEIVYNERTIKNSGFERPFSNYQIAGWILLTYEILLYFIFYITALKIITGVILKSLKLKFQKIKR